ncbi:tripartite tricarboxylate transporter TctB family protein [Psychromarinibacter halotolerans]|uniref:Tripartite tricarboxylate transporter TctB family protein n=1 Tax=Psychromarinibacter halotolerans TaxID=1775175 RepID=A0ABV7GR88_9RHOB|nr:tripartite tricarboxylate transporter TctB family protein [Psychromarinibacter halotolerans]MDF0595188.1 tripartite tricarboxylate transporter TctB family protein [Psychromarinibacter halotolerans]
MARETGTLLRSLMAGAVVAAFGAFVAAIALTYPLGSAFRPGPGFVPLGIGVLLIVLGVIVAVEDARAGGAPSDETATDEAVPVWRPMVATVAGVLVFALLLDRVGYVPASILLVLIVARGERGRNWLIDIAIAAFMAVFGTIVFIWGLGLPIDPIVGL